MHKVSENRCFSGMQFVYEHDSYTCKTPMRFGIYLPDVAAKSLCPTLFWLSGLTCTEQNAITKAGMQRVASELGLIIITPDTSPRGSTPDDPDAYDLGHGAGFYLNATQSPWAENYQMASYISTELPELAATTFPVDADRQGIFGHSMGGHGALTIHFRHPDRFKSVSAFAPIVAPATTAWGQKQLTAYLGNDTAQWKRYDACELVNQHATPATILIDQGSDDEFLATHLQPELFINACHSAGQRVDFRLQSGYDHSYYTIATFMEDHLRHHFDALC